MTRRTLINSLLVLIAFGWLLLFAYPGIWAPFSSDDLMNLNGHLSRPFGSLLLDNLRYWSTAYRPLGGIFYVTLYRWFGFNPLPFRVACFGLLALNLGFLWRFALLLSRSREAAFLTLLLASYHAWFVDLFYNTGTVYDLLCYAFYLGAFNVYVCVRSSESILKWRHLAIIIFLYICALDAKEMAVTLPVTLAVYEVIWHGKALWKSGPTWPWREGNGVLATALLSLPYAIGKTSGTGSLVEVPAYQMTISGGRYLDTFHLYLNPLLYQEHIFRDSNTVQLVIVMLAIALLLRNRPMLFAWCFLLISLLPVAFIAHYAAFFLYLPMAGWALYAAMLLVTIRRFLIKLVDRIVKPSDSGARWLQAGSVVLFPILVALFLAPQHRRESIKTLAHFETMQPPSREVAAQLIALRPTMPRGAHILFIGDPYPQNEYFLLFLTRALYHDIGITVDKLPANQNPQPQTARYDAVFRYQNGQLNNIG
ncbi:MAG TPA: hypothetical protein VHY84_04315 [Bryobacteraceae bacterium]|nr:hypothetical protein [Bryobacteraceae bacterium]